jgi:predicted NBD/HSP70 family sugar kinase
MKMQTANSQSVKINNTQLVLEKMIEIRETTRIELSKLTTLNKATISSIVQELVKRKFVLETERTIKTAGRSANVIILNKNAGRIFSVELLPKELYAIITNLYGEILFEIRKPIFNPEFNFYLSDLMKTIDELKKNTFDSVYGIIGIGIGVYGILSKDKKIKFTTFNSWKDIELKKIIEDYCGIKTYVENEANISALGEKISYPDYEHLVTLNIGTGVGVGIIIGNSLYTGNDGFAGEFGHTIIVPGGKQCICGNKGCLERYIANDAIIERYFELTNETITMDTFIKKYKLGDPFVLQVYNEFISYVSLAINNIAQTLNPKAIIISSVIVESITESISLIKNGLRSKIMNLELLTTSKFKSKTNVLGLTHLLIQDFFNVSNFYPKV